MMLRLSKLYKRYGKTKAVDGISLELAAGETLALLGPSGCGKSSLLRLIAGLERADEGGIYLVAGEVERDLSLQPPQARGVGMVFQDYALFPHLNVERNIAYGLVEQGWSRRAQAGRVATLLEMLGLQGYEKRRIHELSGGEQQRVALARALAPQPPVLLLDEPLSNLDAALRDDLKEQLKDVLEHLDITAVYVTHDQSEAFTLADRIAVMRAGKLQQIGSPAELYAQPQSAWVARFLGHSNIYPTLAHEGLKFLTTERLETPYLLIRSDLVQLCQGDFEALLLRHTQVNAMHLLDFRLQPFDIILRWSGFTRELPSGLQIGKTLKLHIPDEAIIGISADESNHYRPYPAV